MVFELISLSLKLNLTVTTYHCERLGGRISWIYSVKFNVLKLSTDLYVQCFVAIPQITNHCECGITDQGAVNIYGFMPRKLTVFLASPWTHYRDKVPIYLFVEVNLILK